MSLSLVRWEEPAAGISLAPSPAAVVAYGLTRRFGTSLALDGVNLNVPSGSVTLLSGANGAGKSTLMRLLLNLDSPTAGRIEVNGLDPSRHGPQIRANAGHMPEEVEPGNAWLKVGRWFAHRAAYYRGWDHAYAEQLIHRLGIDLNRRVGELSKGEARRIQLVAALAHRPSLLLLDEPTDGFDPVVRDTVLELLAAHLAETGCTMLVSTHLAGEVDRLVDNVAVLHCGRLIAQGTREAIVGTIARHEIDAPANWSMPPTLAPLVLRAERGLGRTHLVVTDSPIPQVAAALSATGATIRSTSGVGLADAILLLLQNGQRR